MKFLFYSIGGGNGHFNRILTIILALKIQMPTLEISWIHSNPFYKLLGLIPGLKHNFINLHATKSLILTSIQEIFQDISSNEFDLLFVDTFYMGRWNEIPIENIQLIPNRIFCYRLLNAEANQYLKLLVDKFPDIYTCIFIPNDESVRNIPALFQDQKLYFTGQIVLTPVLWNLFQQSMEISIDPQSFSFGPSTKRTETLENQLKLHVMHFGRLEELIALQTLVIQSHNLLQLKYPDLSIHVSYFGNFQQAPETSDKSGIYHIFPGFLASMTADLIIGGGGYNLLNEGLFSQVPIISLPFDRTFDDQNARLKALQPCFPDLLFTEILKLQKFNPFIKKRPFVSPNFFNGAMNCAKYLLSLC